jgi:hypothetical protein
VQRQLENKEKKAIKEAKAVGTYVEPTPAAKAGRGQRAAKTKAVEQQRGQFSKFFDSSSEEEDESD